MSDLRQAAQQALEALKKSHPYSNSNIDLDKHSESITALRAALAQPEPEPVAWRYDEATYRPDDLRGRQWHFTLFSTRKPYADEMVQNVTPLYTTPPQRQPLTDDQIDEIIYSMAGSDRANDRFTFVRAIERAHGII